MTPHEKQGIELTDKILATVAPLFNGLPVDLVIETMAAVMLGTVIVGCPDHEDIQTVLFRLAEKIASFALNGPQQPTSQQTNPRFRKRTSALHRAGIRHR
jgi:hypothetical protein